MRHIMVLNSKGGSGKSTIATSLAAYYAGRGESVALVDYDQQASSLDWLARRPENRPQITGVAGFEDGFKHLPRSADLAIIDAPAANSGSDTLAAGNRFWLDFDSQYNCEPYSPAFVATDVPELLQRNGLEVLHSGAMPSFLWHTQAQKPAIK